MCSVNTDNYMGGIQATSLLAKHNCDILIHINSPTDIPHLEYLFTRPKEGLIELSTAIHSQSQLFSILFSDSRQGLLVKKLEKHLKSKYYEKYPEHKNNLERDLLLSVSIQGCFHAFFSHSEDDFDTVIDILGDINECLLLNYKPFCK